MDAGACASIWHGFFAGHRFADRHHGFHSTDSAFKSSPANTTPLSGKQSLKQVKSSVPRSRKKGFMSQATWLDEARKSSAPASMRRSGAGTVVKPAERTTHYLHLSAITCERCSGPVLSGWIGRRADGITREERVNTVGAICLSCGLRPDAPVNPDGATHIRPFSWEWPATAVLPHKQNDVDPLSLELSQDADTSVNLAVAKKVGGL